MGRNIMDAYLGARPPSEAELNRINHGYAQTRQMFGDGYKPMDALLVYTDEALVEGFREAALESGILMDQLEVARYTHENIFELSRRSVAIMASMPSAKFSGLIDYKIHANAITDTEIRDYSHYHTGIDYGDRKSFSVHVDSEVCEVPSEEERLNIAYNNQLLNLIIDNELDEVE